MIAVVMKHRHFPYSCLAILSSVLVAMAAYAQSAQTTHGIGSTLHVYAAGSLRGPLTHIASLFEQQGMGQVKLVFGASGLLREKIANGEPADVFASANMEHPQSLSAGGAFGPTRMFVQNALCLLSSPHRPIRSDEVVATLLDPSIRIGISTPIADPSGDYAFAMFDNMERTGLGDVGSAAALKARALQLTGGPQSPPPPAGRSVYAELMAKQAADVFITYCTNAISARNERPELRITDIPSTINVVANYGMTVRIPASDHARRWEQFVASSQTSTVFVQYGFKLP